MPTSSTHRSAADAVDPTGTTALVPMRQGIDGEARVVDLNDLRRWTNWPT
jgi:hypothetical protein